MSIDLNYQLIRSKRKTVSIQLSKEGEVIVRAPLRLSVQEIEKVILRHTDWIAKHKEKMRQAQEHMPAPLSREEVEDLAMKAKRMLPGKVSAFSAQMKLSPTGITITAAKTRWGSCSGKNRLSFPYRLMLLPDELIDYIVVHELAHIQEKNHGPRFYALVAEFMPDYRTRVKKLRALERTLPPG